MTALGTDTRTVEQLIDDLDRHVTDGELEVDEGFTVWAALEEVNRRLATIRANLGARLAEQMDDKRYTVEGVGTFERHRKADRKAWMKDDLLRVVLDSRMADTTTGEFLDETPLAKVLSVWNLGAPRTTALRERGIDADQFCETEYGNLTLQKVG